MKNIYVSQAALIARINRKLTADGEILRKGKEGSELAPFYKLDTFNNRITDYGLDLIEVARELDVIHPATPGISTGPDV